jgi:hypothetical protein
MSNDYLGSLFKHKKLGSESDLDPGGQIITDPAETGSYLHFFVDTIKTVSSNRKKIISMNLR